MTWSEPPAPGLNDLSTLRAVWDRAADAMALSGPDGTVLAVNPAYCRLYGSTPMQLVGQSFAVIFPPEVRAEAEQQYRDIFARGEDSLHESRVRSADGIELIVEARASFIERDAQRLAMLSTIRDITAQRQAEADRDAFVASASHDLLQPLTLIKARAELLLRKLGDEAPVDALKRDLTIINASVEDLAEQLSALVDAVRLGAGGLVQLDLQPVQIGPWLQRLVDRHQAGATAHALRLEAAPQPLVVRIDEVRMRRVVSNLLSNATKYSPGGGEIHVRVSADTTAGTGGRVMLEVADHGIGIPAADLPHIFTPYHRAANVIGVIPGSGLGLAGALAIVEQHGGALEVDSAEGLGTTFRLYLPSAVSEAET